MKYFLLVILICTTAVVWSQECDHEPSDKVQKLLDKAADKRKYDAEERFGFLEKALEEDEECTECLKRMGHLLFLRAKNGGGSFSQAESYLVRLVEGCPEYHSEPLYELGAICYASQEYDRALAYFDQFIHFPDDDPEKFTKKYDRQYEEVQQSLPKIEFWPEI